MKKIGSIIFLLLFGTVWYFVIHKALTIPMTHDETATPLHYCKYSVWEIMMFPDNWPNNHILNTLFVKLFTWIFGVEQWVVRLPNMLFFPVFASGVYLIGRQLFKESVIGFVATAIIFFSNAYLLDFFSLCRGYGISCALATLSSAFLLMAYQRRSTKLAWGAFLTAILASYANFTLLVFWGGISILFGFYILLEYWRKWNALLIRLAGILVLNLAYLALIITPLRKMTGTGQFDYWSSKGFYEDTIVSLTEHWRYNENLIFELDRYAVANIVLIVLAISVLLSLFFIIRKQINAFHTEPIIIAIAILGFTAGVSILQSFLLSTPNLNGRTALFFYPLVSLVIVALLSVFYRWKILGHTLALTVAALSLWHIYKTHHPKDVREWWYDACTFEVLDYLAEAHKDDTGKITLRTHWFFHPSFNFYSATGKIPQIQLHKYDKGIDPNAEVMYYYVMEGDVGMLKGNYEEVGKFGWDKYLMKRK
ncbi:MAG: hypothetical protein MK212_01125 [Saprospiraceae bacterium]|nr:hypothetical protein [Saprospiraceae bacterium]